MEKRTAVLNEKDTAMYIGMSTSWLRQTRMNGQIKGRTPGPPYIKIGRSVRYHIADLDAWLDEHRVIDNWSQR